MHPQLLISARIDWNHLSTHLFLRYFCYQLWSLVRNRLFPSLSKCFLGIALTKEKDDTNFEWLTAAVLSYWNSKAYLVTVPSKRLLADRSIEVDLENEDFEIPDLIKLITVSRVEIIPSFENIVFTNGFHKIIQDRLVSNGIIIFVYSPDIVDKLERYFKEYMIKIENWLESSEISKALQKSIIPLKASWRKYCYSESKHLLGILERGSRAIVLTKTSDLEEARRSWVEFQSIKVQQNPINLEEAERSSKELQVASGNKREWNPNSAPSPPATKQKRKTPISPINQSTLQATNEKRESSNQFPLSKKRGIEEAELEPEIYDLTLPEESYTILILFKKHLQPFFVGDFQFLIKDIQSNKILRLEVTLIYF